MLKRAGQSCNLGDALYLAAIPLDCLGWLNMNTIGCKQRRATCWQAERGAEDASGIKNFGPGAAGLAEGQQRRAGALSLALCGLRDVPLGELELRLHECRGFLVDKPWA